MKKVFEKNNIFIPILAIGLLILSIAIEAILNVITPGEWGTFTVSKIIIMTVIKLVLSIIFCFYSSKIIQN